MPGNIKRSIIKALAAAAAATALCGLFFTLTKPETETASALVSFSTAAESSAPVDTSVSRSISSLRKLVTDKDTVSKAASASGISEDELYGKIAVERLGSSNSAEIKLYDLPEKEIAPIILAHLINLADKSDAVPEFSVVSYCDISHAPTLPYAALSLSAGLVSALAVFVVSQTKSRHHHRRHERTAKATKEAAEYIEAVYLRDVMRSALERSVKLGDLPLTAPDGLEKSGYNRAFSKLLAAAPDASPLIIAVTSGQAPVHEAIPFEARLTAYLSCSAAALGKRTAVIECNLKEPSIHKIFGTSGSGGLAALASGSCTVWNALALNARDGVDIIAEKESYPVPIAIFGSASFSQLILYLSSQYDVILLNAPKAWGCDEWPLIQRHCTGIAVAVKAGSEIDRYAAKGIMNTENCFTAYTEIYEHKPDTAAEYTADVQ